MDDLISRSYLLSEYDRQHKGKPGSARKIIEEAPSAEKKGKWIRHPIYPGSDHYYYSCSECDYRSWSQDNYCSVCGAKMEGEEVENDE